MRDGRGVEAVERAFTLLDCFDASGTALSLAELARRSGLYKSTILRLAVSLERFGLMLRQPDGRYRLGPTTWRLGSAYRASFALAETIRPELRHLSEATGETASFYVREGDGRVCLYRHEPTRSIRHAVVEGARLPLDRGAAGHVLRAFGADAKAGDAAIRDLGFGMSLGERDPEVAAIAAPVFCPSGTLSGALALSGLVTRFGEDTRAALIEAVCASAARLSATPAQSQG